MEKLIQPQFEENSPKREPSSVRSSQEMPKSIRQKLRDSPEINFCKNQSSMEGSINQSQNDNIDPPDTGYFQFSPPVREEKNPTIRKDDENDFIK